ncbi:MAG TPA: AAA family ATPase [Candidatus Methylomirabilis sp.]|nr:AAA family ATPase [Candidatus Methylomirabilis sp.]
MTAPLTPEALRRICPAADLPFETTDDLEALDEIVAQDRAVQAITFGIGIRSAGFNLFALGQPGTGKATAVRRFLSREAAKLPTPPDWCYVYNFADPHRPRAIRLSPGRAHLFQRDCESLVQDLKTGIPRAFETEAYEQQKTAITQAAEKEQAKELEALKERVEAKGFALAKTPSGVIAVPVLRGKPLDPETLKGLDEAAREEFGARHEAVQGDVTTTMRRLREIEKDARAKLEALDREVASSVVGHLMDEIRQQYIDTPDIVAHFEAAREDILEHADLFRRAASGQANPMEILAIAPPGRDPFDRYRVNVLVEHGDGDGAPVVLEPHPTCPNLLGRVEYQAHMGTLFTDFTLVKAGALHRANGGFLVIEALELLKQYFSWDPLKRTLKNRRIRIEEPGEQFRTMSTQTLEPEPIPLDVKVVLLGSPWLYYLLYAFDPEFAELFKVKVDFSDQVVRTPENVLAFSRVLATCCREEGLRPFEKAGVAKLVEQSSRMVEDQERLSTNFGEILDVAREASFWAERHGHDRVGAVDVGAALQARIYRSNRVEELLQDLILQGTLLIDTQGAVVGQVNGIAVIPLGDYVFGKPSRITARTYLGRGGILDIEREAKTGGRIHSKGMLILSGYLGGRYAGDLPLAMGASVAFEQLYEEVEGDSASSAELYAILSSLAGLPIRQGLAVTGSVNQHGEVQAIGGVNAKIEGFFDVCKARGISADQGVLIPQSNARNLMLREDVVEAVQAGKFHVYPVRTIDAGIALLTGVAAGERGADGAYPEGSVNFLVQKRLREMAEQARAFRGNGEASPSRRENGP